MNNYERLQSEAYDNGVMVKEMDFDSNSLGLYYNNKIAINKYKLDTNKEKVCVLAEELGHHYTSVGDILDLNILENSKQEAKARLHAFNNLIGLTGIINAYNAQCKNLYDMAEYLNVTEEFLNDAIKCYKNKYGRSVSIDNYQIIFLPYLQIYISL